MSKKKPEEDQVDEPTRWSVQEIFDELIKERRYDHEDRMQDDPKYQAAEQDVKDRQEQLEKDPKLLKLIEARDRLHVEIVARTLRLSKEAKKVRRLYNAKGLTPDVKKAVEDLVKEANK